MRNPFQTPFVAVFTNEVLLNIKRTTPYLLMLLFSANAVLWWGWGPAVESGWATNSDFYIRRNLGGFSIILGLPIFTAVIMGDPVIRDFRLGIDPLIFSKSVNRGSYILGKFLGNFFVLVCCQSTFAITLFLLQWVPFSGMVTLPVRVTPYFKHFLIAVVISHLVLAAVYFTAGTLSRNARVVYVLAACFYPVFIGYQFLLRELPEVFRILLDPIGFNYESRLDPWSQSAEFLNQYVVGYGMLAYANRVSMIIISGLLLLLVYLRFRIEGRASKGEFFTRFTLSDASGSVAYSAPFPDLFDSPGAALPVREQIPLPQVTTVRGPVATLFKLIAAVEVEFRLLRAERSLIVLVPLAIFLSFLSVPFSRIAPEVSYSVTSATNTANMLLLFLACVIVFYTGEVMHRDREVRIEPVVWSTPAPNSVLLLSKFLAISVLALLLVVVGGLTTIVTQLSRGYTPIEISAYLVIDSVVVVPGLVFMASFVIGINVLLRNKYLAYVVSLAIGAGLFYIYSIGFNHWLYNPLLYRLWTYVELTTAGKGQVILVQRIYCLGVAGLALALAHLFFERKTAKRVLTDGHLSNVGWSFLAALISVAIIVITGWRIVLSAN